MTYGPGSGIFAKNASGCVFASGRTVSRRFADFRGEIQQLPLGDNGDDDSVDVERGGSINGHKVLHFVAFRKVGNQLIEFHVVSFCRQ